MNKLIHVGILGMRWGRRKGPPSEKDLLKERNKKDRILKEKQKQYDKKLRNVDIQVKAYNRAVDYTNNVLIPRVNKKYEGVNFSSLKFDETGRAIGNSKLAKIYDKYFEEYNKGWEEAFNTALVDLIGTRPE